MDEFIRIFFTPWGWLGLGVVLLVMEAVLPGAFMLWLGLAALGTGILTLVTGISLPVQLVAFAVFAFVSVLVGRRYFQQNPGVRSHTEVNEPGGRHVGRILTVVEPISGGRGRVKLNDSPWIAEGPDAALGTKVRVVAVDGAVLTVEPA
ncbi:MAG: NfeD family protein [Pacificimonas sp.]